MLQKLKLGLLISAVLTIFYLNPTVSNSFSLDRFKKLALYGEDGSLVGRIIKWPEEIRIAFMGRVDTPVVNWYYDYIDQLSEIINRPISTVDVSEPHEILIVGLNDNNIDQFLELTKEKQPRIYSTMQMNESDTLCHFYMTWTKDYHIARSIIFFHEDIDFKLPTYPQNIIRCLKEEITQSLGLANDIDYDGTLFSHSKTLNKLSEEDKEMLQFLYSDEVPAGADVSEIELMYQIYISKKDK